MADTGYAAKSPDYGRIMASGLHKYNRSALISNQSIEGVKGRGKNYNQVDGTG